MNNQLIVADHGNIPRNTRSVDYVMAHNSAWCLY